MWVSFLLVSSLLLIEPSTGCYTAQTAGSWGWGLVQPGWRRRMKRSTSTAISQAYGKLHPDLIDRHAMENFLRFDLNRDGLIALEEAKRINATIKDFERVDANNDGFVHPAEFDASLK